MPYYTYGGKQYYYALPTTPKVATQPAAQTTWRAAAAPVTAAPSAGIGGYAAPTNPAALAQPIQTSLNMGQAPSQPTPASGMGMAPGMATMPWQQAAMKARAPTVAPMSFGAGQMAAGQNYGGQASVNPDQPTIKKRFTQG